MAAKVYETFVEFALKTEYCLWILKESELLASFFSWFASGWRFQLALQHLNSFHCWQEINYRIPLICCCRCDALLCHTDYVTHELLIEVLACWLTFRLFTSLRSANKNCQGDRWSLSDEAVTQHGLVLKPYHQKVYFGDVQLFQI